MRENKSATKFASTKFIITYKSAYFSNNIYKSNLVTLVCEFVRNDETTIKDCQSQQYCNGLEIFKIPIINSNNQNSTRAHSYNRQKFNRIAFIATNIVHPSNVRTVY